MRRAAARWIGMERRSLTALAGAVLAAGCSSLPRASAEPIPAEAQALAERAYREQRHDRDEQALELWARAAAVAPDWVTPKRALQLAELEALRGPEVLERAARDCAASALGASLHARLLPPADDPFAAVARAGSAWGAHGRGVHRLLAGDHEEAVTWARRAVERARSELDRVLFLQGLARALTATGDAGRAQALLLLRRAYLQLPENALLRAELLLTHRDTWGAEGEHEAERRWWRAAASIWGRDPRLTSSEQRRLAMEALGADVAHELGREPLLGPGAPARASVRRLPRFERGDGFNVAHRWRPSWDSWVAELPHVLKDEQGRLLDPAWREAVRLAERGAPLEEPDVVRALLAVGAVEQADAYRMLGQSPGTDWAAEGEALRRLRAGVEELASGELRLLESQAAQPGASAGAGGSLALRSPGSPREALRALDQRLAPLAGLAPFLDGIQLEEASLDSLGPVATLLLPVDPSGTPRGPAGSLLERTRSWLQVTWPLGMEPQVVLGQALLVETTSGTLLGRPWSGTRAVLRGVTGTTVGGAAHPGGYWVDAGGAAAARERFGRLRDRYREAGDLERALATRARPAASSEEAAELLPLLGEGDRLALALMAAPDRLGSESGSQLVLPSVGALLEVAMRHEEAHLADYREWLPVWRSLPSILGVVAEGAFTVRGTWAHVEARAQLAALCASPDPRLALVEILWLVEELQRGGAAGPYPHAEGYRDLLRELLVALEARLADADSALDASRVLCHQLHRVGAEELRAAALHIACGQGLVASGWSPSR